MYAYLIPVILVLTTFPWIYYRAQAPPRNRPSRYREDGRDCVVFLGDSITHGKIGANYVDILQEEFQQYSMVNGGINSQLAYNALQRVDEVLRCSPSKVFVLIGTNDANASLPENARMYTVTQRLPQTPSRSWYRQNLRSIVKSLQDHTDVYLISIPTIGENPRSLEFRRSTEYAGVIREVSEEFDCGYVPFHEKMIKELGDGSSPYPFEKWNSMMVRGIVYRYLLGYSWDKVGRGFRFHADYLHLNTEGARMLAELIGDELRDEALGGQGVMCSS